jgi:glyoxylase-like metal-dependent hydrolase (beta-lactamase superfamily II)
VTSPDASLTQDESFVPTSRDGLVYPFGRFAPEPGTLHSLAEGVHWARIRFPGSLGHINCWVLDDGDGVAICDTGMDLPVCREDWDALFAGPLRDRAVSRVIGTHFHPDHIGLAGALAARSGGRIWMTRGEWLTAQLSRADARDSLPEDVVAMRRAAGWNETQIDAARSEGWGRMRKIVSELPVGYRRIRDGDVITIGRHDWRVVTGCGHSPEHACLINDREGLMISGDQVLPRISSNVSLSAGEPDADPLGDWLSSIDKLLNLPDDLLVLPAHGGPFRGLHARLIALRDEHRQRLDELAAALDAPRRAVDCFELLFRRVIDQSVLGLASGEALSHLRRLEVEGRATREVRDGTWWFRAA